MSEQSPFGERMRRRRMALGWSQREFAERMLVPPPAISRYESGTYKSITFGQLRKLAETLATSSDYLLGLRDDPGPVPNGVPAPGDDA